MKIAPVDRYGGWRPGGAGSESRTAAATRLQAAAPESAPDALAATLSVGRELPVVPVKQGVDVQLRMVQTSDRPKGVDPALNVFDEFSVAVAPLAATVDVFSPSRPPSDVSSQVAEVSRQQAVEAAKQPPKEPLTKMLIDLVQNVWEASRFVVDAGIPHPKPGAPTLQAIVPSTSTSNAASVKAYIDTAAAGVAPSTPSKIVPSVN